MVGLASAVVVGVLVALWFAFPDLAQVRHAAEIVALCLVIVAASGRGLLGFAGAASESSPRWAAWRRSAAWAAVSGAAVLPYLHSLSVGFLSDDFGMLWAARSARSTAEALQARPLEFFLRPAPMLAWWSGVHLWGGAAVGYHLLSILLHGANSLLVYVLARRLIGSSYGALAAGLLFALHPLHVEPVVWACANSDLLCTLFSLLSLLCLEAYLAAGEAKRRSLALAGALAWFGCALMSKEAALALPGVAALRVFLGIKEERWRRALPVVASYAVVLAAYLAWRVSEIGGLGGYRTRFGFWTSVFPSALLRQTVSFFFPANRALFEHTSGGAWLLALVVAAMALGLLWWVRSLKHAAAARLWLWFGFVVVMTIPVRALPAGAPDLEGSRLAYLPMIGFVWLFGDICAARGSAWRRTGVTVTATLLLAAALTVWYVTPWRAAHRISESLAAGAASLLDQLEQRAGGGAELYLQGVPETHCGAQVVRNCLRQAITSRRGRLSLVHVVGRSGDLPSEVMARTELVQGQYLAAWQEPSGGFRIIR